jgi:hypothetical protein
MNLHDLGTVENRLRSRCITKNTTFPLSSEVARFNSKNHLPDIILASPVLGWKLASRVEELVKMDADGQRFGEFDGRISAF